MKMNIVRPLVFAAAIVVSVSSSGFGQVNTLMSANRGALEVTLEFANLPEPLQTTTVNATFEVLKPIEGELRIWVSCADRFVRLESEPLLAFAGPLEVGEIRNGTIEIVPLVAGFHGFQLITPKWPRRTSDLWVNWCLDEDGNLHYLGIERNQPMARGEPPDHIPQPEPSTIVFPDGHEEVLKPGPVYNPSSCTVTKTTFFDDQLVEIIGEPERSPHFESVTRIEPPFRIGDTSTVTYRLRMIDGIPDGLKLSIEATGFLVVDTPGVIDYSLSENQVVDITMKVVPLAVGPTTTLDVGFEGEPVSSQLGSVSRISMHTVFFDDGFLRYITPNRFRVFDPTKLPQSFPPIDRAKHIQRIVIKSDD